MNALSKTTHRVFRGRFGAIAWFAVLYVAVAFVTRCVLLAKSAVDVSWDLSLVGSFVLGLVYDLCAAAWFSLPLILGLTLLPARTFGTRVGRAITPAHLPIQHFPGRQRGQRRLPQTGRRGDGDAEPTAPAHAVS